MRRVYQNRGKSKLRRQAMDQFRQTRDQISREHPNLLSSIRDQISGLSGIPDIQDTGLIDQQKNIRTVMKVLELESGSEAFQAKVKQVLMNHHSGFVN